LDIAAQVLYARRREWAVSADDVLRRRTTVWVRGESPEALRKTEELFGVPAQSSVSPHTAS
jgi:glycerol-3-phosphate dehydrogenase